MYVVLPTLNLEHHSKMTSIYFLSTEQVFSCLLQEEVLEGDLEEFTFVEINGMRLTEPVQVRNHPTLPRHV